MFLEYLIQKSVLVWILFYFSFQKTKHEVIYSFLLRLVRSDHPHPGLYLFFMVMVIMQDPSICSKRISIPEIWSATTPWRSGFNRNIDDGSGSESLNLHRHLSCLLRLLVVLRSTPQNLHAVRRIFFGFSFSVFFFGSSSTVFFFGTSSSVFFFGFSETETRYRIPTSNRKIALKMMENIILSCCRSYLSRLILRFPRFLNI